jgi:hypothetical protein
MPHSIPLPLYSASDRFRAMGWWCLAAAYMFPTASRVPSGRSSGSLAEAADLQRLRPVPVVTQVGSAATSGYRVTVSVIALAAGGIGREDAA